MRELQLYPAKKRPLPDVVRRVQFVAGGTKLVAWTDENHRAVAGGIVHQSNVYAVGPASGVCGRLKLDGIVDSYGGPASDPVVSPDGRLVVTEVPNADGYENFLHFQKWHDPNEQLPDVDTTPVGGNCLFFTPDGGALVAVRSGETFEDELRDVARFEIAQLAAPARDEGSWNPFTGEMMKRRVHKLKWKRLLAPPPWPRVGVAALSADGRFLVVSDLNGVIHVADLKKKKVIASFPAEGKKYLDRIAEKIGFDPAARWVVRNSGGKLFARPLAGGKPWQTKPALGYASDFAFHPSGRVVCAVFLEGHASYLDPHTGAVQRSFKWGRKSLHSVCFAPDGLTCAAGGENGRVVIWDVDA